MSACDKEIQKKYLKTGFDNLNECEKLELILSFTNAREIKQKAKYMIDEYGSLKSVFNANIDYLISDAKIGDSAVIFIKLIQCISKEYLQSKDTCFMDSEASIFKYFQLLYIGEAEEKLYIVSVDKSIKNINSYVISSGSFNNVEVPLRKIIDIVISKDSLFGIFISHNHPCSNPEPSPADIELTYEIIKILHSYQIKVFDHIIVGLNSSVTSLKSLVQDINFDDMWM